MALVVGLMIQDGHTMTSLDGVHYLYYVLAKLKKYVQPGKKEWKLIGLFLIRGLLHGNPSSFFYRGNYRAASPKIIVSFLNIFVSRYSSFSFI